MKKYIVKTPGLIKIIFYKWIWSFSKKEKVIYLTFDDGPTPEITNWTLNELKKHNAKATFFCIGKNILEHPTVFQKIINEGHSVGNHTHNHLKGLKTAKEEYLNNVLLAEETMQQFNYATSQQKSMLFRPPYGKLTLKQASALRKKGYKIIMWDVLSADFDTTISAKKCLENVIKNTQNGSILVFHDSVKASEKLKYVLPKILNFYASKNYTFKNI